MGQKLRMAMELQSFTIKKNEICSGSKIITLSNYERHLSFLSVSETIMREDSYMVVTLQGCGGVG